MPPTSLRPRLVAPVILAAVVAAACGSASPAPSPTPTVRPAATKTPAAPAPTPQGALPAAAQPSTPAPVLVQVENLPDARPLSGLSGADILYEYATEGGITRFTAIYFNGAKGAVGPVRSARLVSPVLTAQYGGFLVYSGASNYTNRRLVASGTPRFDETSAAGDLFRVGYRFAPHNLYTDIAHLADLVRRAARPAVGYSLWSRTATPPSGGISLAHFTVPLSNWERPSYTWNAAAGGWVRTDTTGTFTDADTGAAMIAPTVVVQQVPAQVNPADVEDVSGAAGMEYTLSGSGPVQVFTAGQEFDGTWTQPASGPPQLVTTSGAPIPIPAGQVWICLVPTGQRAF